MQQNDKYFGMKPRQLGILGGLAVTACLLVGLVGWFGWRGSQTPTGAPQSVPVSQSTATPWTIPSPVPTGTATLVPYESLIPTGWTQSRTTLVEIWMPPEFRPGDPLLFNNSSYKGVGELILSNSREDSAPYKMLVIVSYEPLTDDSLDLHLDAGIAKLPADIRVAQRTKVTLNAAEVVRFVYEMRYNNSEVNDLTYVFLDGGTVWYVEYIARINEFFEMLSVFEKSAQTFRMVR
jgi:hypothetical protein